MKTLPAKYVWKASLQEKKKIKYKTYANTKNTSKIKDLKYEKLRNNLSWAAVVHVFNLSTWEVEANLWVQDKPGPQSKFQDRQGYRETLCRKFKN